MPERTMPPLRVASVPAGHPYVASIAPDPTVARMLADPVVPGRAPGQWWPPVLLDPAYLRAHDAEFDLLHVHFGLESLPAGRLEEALRIIGDRDIPLVFTVHDLENPQLADQSAYRDRLAAVIDTADELITLTPGVAAHIAARWGRRATVIPHPRMAAHHPMGRPSLGSLPRIGVHLRDLRPNIAAVETVREVIAAVHASHRAGMPVTAVVRMDDAVRDPAAAADVERLMRSAPGVVLERGGRQDDAELEQWIAGLHATVLPYSHGTHSGWAELCWDLGVVVIDDGHGFVSEQLPDGLVGRDRTGAHDGGGGSGLVTAFARALRLATAPGSAERRAVLHRNAAFRDRQAIEVRQAHAAVYERALAGIRRRTEGDQEHPEGRVA
jgi:hypothetical protein